MAWVYDSASGRTLPSVYTTSSDGGETFSVPRETGFLAQTTKMTALPDGSVFCAYRRNDAHGLWATVARLEGERWRNVAEAPLWQGAESGMAGKASGGDELAQLRFGYPSGCRLPDGRAARAVLVSGRVHDGHPLAADPHRGGGVVFLAPCGDGSVRPSQNLLSLAKIVSEFSVATGQ